jgi:hypothetical protein
MIQRIQTLWLLAASAFAFLTLRFSFYSGHKTGDVQKQFVALNGTSTIPIIVLTVVVAILSLVLIFLYKDRKMQMRLTFTALALSVLNIVLYFLEKGKYVPEESSFDLTSILVFAIPVFLILAFRGIYKDQKLIKSVDRLR